ncbi:hypothetical protein COV94_03800, partial [Candidatus Woesearchaeota archaeon CG11_big_fil_rev_8_21_14_0_20_57_5]
MAAPPSSSRPSIATKTGDDGTTALIGGKRVPKHDILLEAYGTVDELNAAIGLALADAKQQSVIMPLRHVQNDLFIIGALLASAGA